MSGEKQMNVWNSPGGLAQVLRVTLPLQLMAASSAAYAFVDRMLLAKCSDLALEASVPGLVLGGTLSAFMVTAVGYSAVFVAQSHGSGDRDGALRSFAQGLWLALASIPLYFFAHFAGDFAIWVAGHAPELAAAESGFLDRYLPGLWLQSVAAVAGGYFSGQGRTSVFGVAGSAGFAAALFFAWALVLGNCGAPRLGLNGSAYAFALGQLVSCAVLAVALFRDPHVRARMGALRGLLRLEPRLAFGVLRYGSENGAMAFFDNLTFMAFVMVTGRLDAMSLAVSNMVFGVNCVFFALVSGLRDGVSVLVGRFCGRRDYAAAERSLRSTLAISVAVAASFGAFVAFGAGWLADSFRAADSAFDREAFRSLASVVFSILAFRALAESFVEPCAGALRGAGDTRWLMFTRTMCGFFVWMPAVALVAGVKPSLPALWLTMPVYLAFLAFVFLRRWRSGRWRERAELMESARAPVRNEA